MHCNKIGDKKMATTTKQPVATPKASNGKLTHDELIKLVQRRLGGGRTLKQVADEFALSISSVRRLRDSNGQTPVKPGSSKDPAWKRPAKTAVNGKAPKTEPAKDTGDFVVVKAAQLFRLLSDVQPFRGNDDTLPMLTCTHVEWDGKQLLAATTDRFTLGVSKLDAAETGVVDGLEDVSFMLWPNDVSTLLKVAKTVNRDADWRLVTISKVGEIPAGCTVPTYTIKFAFFTGEQIIIKPADVEFPKFKQLIPSGEPVARAMSGLNASYLAKFAKIASHDGRMRMYSFDDSSEGGAKPNVVLIGDDFVGMIMPVRCPDDGGWRKPSWVR
jgi:DNA polymerase III beta subunit, central domain